MSEQSENADILGTGKVIEAVNSAVVGSVNKKTLGAPTSYYKGVKVTIVTIDCADCNDAVAKLTADDKPGETKGKWTSPPPGKPTFSQQGDGTWKATKKVTFSLDVAHSSIRVKKPSWPKMTSVERETVNQCTQDLLVHEQGHIDVWQDVLKRYSGELEGTGANKDEAQADLDKKISENTAKFQDAWDAKNKEYDDTTDHGKRQSNGPASGFPGGNDVELNCP